MTLHPSRVLCCYVTSGDYYRNPVHPSIREHAPHAQFVEIDPDDKYQYWHEINSRFDGEMDLIIVEPDVEITAETIPGLAACERNWCTYAYDISGQEMSFCLGCTKFSRLTQFVLTGGFTVPLDRHKWSGLDLSIMKSISQVKGIVGSEHVHGRVTHHHDYSNRLVRQNPVGSMVPEKDLTYRSLGMIKKMKREAFGE